MSVLDYKDTVKRKTFYWVVAADARAKRDGKYLEKIGTYNPNTNPATIDLNLDKQMVARWCSTNRYCKQFFLQRSLLKHHLDGGIRKGALTQEQVIKLLG
jgi:small subunit ribosomal protein S16